jgi:hypothetical protein
MEPSKKGKDGKGGRDRTVKREGEAAGNGGGRLQLPFRPRE